jgi:hypothetical protein
MRAVLALVATFAVLEYAADAKCARKSWLGTPEGTPVPPAGTLYRTSGASVTKVPYETALGALVVTVGSERFIVDPTWTPPADPPRVVAMRHVEHGWTCSSTDAAMLTLDQPVAAIRVSWTREGKAHESLVVPRSRRALDRPSILLGKVGCAGSTFSVAELEAGVALEMTAIRFDGSEVEVEGLPPVLDLDELPRPEKLAAATPQSRR